MERWPWRVVGFAVAVALVFVAPDPWIASARQKKGPCAQDLRSCPAHGCADPGTDDALVNMMKRRKPVRTAPVRLTFDDFHWLQSQADDVVGQNVALDQAGREKLRQLKVKSSDRRVSEGDPVEVIGYLVGLPQRPKESGPESVNCRLPGIGNNDFHIPLASDPDDTEFEAIVVEMVPQDRPEGWTKGKLRRVARERRPVAVRGQLFYDNKHEVNDDPDDVKGGQPKRFSLWEIHPVTDFYVCMTQNRRCDRTNIRGPQWQRLERLRE